MNAKQAELGNTYARNDRRKGQQKQRARRLFPSKLRLHQVPKLMEGKNDFPRDHVPKGWQF